MWTIALDQWLHAANYNSIVPRCDDGCLLRCYSGDWRLSCSNCKVAAPHTATAASTSHQWWCFQYLVTFADWGRSQNRYFYATFEGKYLNLSSLTHKEGSILNSITISKILDSMMSTQHLDDISVQNIFHCQCSTFIHTNWIDKLQRNP